MKDIKIEGTPETPTIKFDASEGMLEIKGRSISQNPVEFFKPLMDSINAYAATPAAITKVDIMMEYFNTSSSRCILGVLRQLSSLHQKGNAVQIKWLYEDGDENMRDVGIDYQAIVNMPFEMTELPSE